MLLSERKLQTDLQCMIYSVEQGCVQMAYLVFQTAFVNGAKLLQQNDRVFSMP